MWEVLLKIFEIVSISYGAVWLKSYLDNRKKRKENDMDEEFVRKSTVLPILQDVRKKLDADRVMEAIFSNGDTTFTGHHMKKLSILAETMRPGLEDIGHYFQYVPIKKFERSLTGLHESGEEWIFYDENCYNDDLSDLKKLFRLNYTLLVKIRDEAGRWIGNLIVSFENDRTISDSEVAFVKAQAARIGVMK